MLLTGLPPFYFMALVVSLIVDLAIKKAVLMALEIAVGLLR